MLASLLENRAEGEGCQCGTMTVSCVPKGRAEAAEKSARLSCTGAA